MTANPTEQINLALTIIAAELHRPGPRDTAVLRRLYQVLGGVAVSGKEGEG